MPKNILQYLYVLIEREGMKRKDAIKRTARKFGFSVRSFTAKLRAIEDRWLREQAQKLDAKRFETPKERWQPE